MSDPQSRLNAASAAWTRLFHNTNTKRQQPEQNNITQLNTTASYTSHDQALASQRPISITQRPTNEMQRNHPWGDILEEKPITITRIYSQNVNGLKLEKDGGQFTEICKIHQEVQADIICIQEHNLDTTQYKVQQIIHQTTQKHWQRSRLNLASSPMTFSST